MVLTVPGDTPASWAERRRRAVTEHAAALERTRAAETGQARALVAEFVRQARERGLPPTPLVARGYGGRGRYRTGLTGWYVHPDRSVAVGIDGGFYLLDVAPSVLARVTGVTLEPCEPRLVHGVGARDGESVPLQTLLLRRLDAGSTWP